MTKTILSPSEELRFEPEGHKYFKGKKRIPGVSEILQKVGLTKDYAGVDSFYRDRGIATHLAIKFYLEGNLDPSSLDPVIQPQFDAFLGYWKLHAKEEIIALENHKCSHDDTFAGTPDLITNLAVYDWKCSKAHDRVAELQGEAYKILAIRKLPFIVVELHDDGSFMEYNYGNQSQLWESVMELYHWRVKR